MNLIKRKNDNQTVKVLLCLEVGEEAHVEVVKDKATFRKYLSYSSKCYQMRFKTRSEEGNILKVIRYK